jgi:nitrite reductase/ring-hydroxylating ferredoxin subunit
MKRVCDLSELAAGASVRFELAPARGRFGGIAREGFALLAPDGEPRAYLNVCPHRGQPVDVGDGRLRLPDGTLECQAHGAIFTAASGTCVGGPCAGAGLTALPLEVRGADVFVRDELADGRAGEPEES